jgi:hypothetical protein
MKPKEITRVRRNPRHPPRTLPCVPQICRSALSSALNTVGRADDQCDDADDGRPDTFFAAGAVHCLQNEAGTGGAEQRAHLRTDLCIGGVAADQPTYDGHDDEQQGRHRKRAVERERALMLDA